jgi:hypothetical protein
LIDFSKTVMVTNLGREMRQRNHNRIVMSHVEEMMMKERTALDLDIALDLNYYRGMSKNVRENH